MHFLRTQSSRNPLNHTHSHLQRHRQLCQGNSEPVSAETVCCSEAAQQRSPQRTAYSRGDVPSVVSLVGPLPATHGCRRVPCTPVLPGCLPGASRSWRQGLCRVNKDLVNSQNACIRHTSLRRRKIKGFPANPSALHLFSILISKLMQV